MTSIRDIEFVKEFIITATDGWKKGWHEINGGNLSYKLSTHDVVLVEEYLKASDTWVSIGTMIPELSNTYVLVSASGRHMRNIEKSLEKNAGIIELNDSGDKYRVRWGFTNGAKPTSELPTHLLNHKVALEKSSKDHNVIYHAHTTNLIALTFVLPLSSEAFTKALWTSATECLVVFPNGVGVIEWMIPGTVEIGVKTSEMMKLYDAVVWSHHGLFVSGSTFDDAFGLMDTIEKSSEILIKALSCGELKQRITDTQLLNLAEAFNVKLRTDFTI